MGISRVQEAARRLGLTLTTAGRATVSAQVAVGAFRKLFPLRDEDSSDGEFDPARALAVPTELAPYVQSISIAPRHEQME